MGGVIKNQTGFVLGAFAKVLGRLVDENLAIKDGLLFAAGSGLHVGIVESDLCNATTAVQERSSFAIEGPPVDDIHWYMPFEQ